MTKSAPASESNGAQVHSPQVVRPESSVGALQQLILATLVALTWLAVIPRAIPSVGSDPRGIYVTVAERLIGGQALYRDVWDNKDPLFFYSVALGRLIGPWMDAVWEIAWLALASFGIWMIACWLGLARGNAVVAGFIVTPVVLTGNMYVAGYTHLPAIAVALMALAVALRHHYLVAGILLGTVWYLNVRVFPLALILVLVPLIVERRVVRLWRVSAGFGLIFGAIALLMQFRGEFVPYLDMLMRNAQYSNSPLLMAGRSPVEGHLDRTLTSSSLVLVWFVLAIAGFALAGSRGRYRVSSREPSGILWFCSVGSLIAAIAVLALTGLWPHHGQVMYIPVLLATLLVMALWITPITSRMWILAMSWLVAALALAGVGWRDYVNAVMNPRGALVALANPSLETRALLSVGDGGSYSRVGQDDERGHGYGSRNWRIACPKFHQYPFDSPEILDATLTCIRGTDVILVSGSLSPQPWNASWNGFVSSVETLLSTEFSCREFYEKRICVRSVRKDSL